MKLKVKILNIALIIIFSINLPAHLYSDSKDFVKFESAKMIFKKGISYYNKMKYLAAAEFFRKAITLYPDYYTARDYLARSYKLAGFADSALKEFENLYEISPENIAVANKIENLRFRNSLTGDSNFNYKNLVIDDIYDSSRYKRFSFSKPVDLAVDNNKNLLITSFSSGKLTIIDANGKGVSTITPNYNSQLYGVDSFKNNFAVSDYKLDLVYILDKNVKIIRTFGSPGKGEGQFYGPKGLCYDSNGFIYIVDSGNHRVQKFDDQGNFILQFGKKGMYEGELSGPTDVVAIRDRIYITDTGNKRLSVFDDSGNFIKNFLIDEVELPRGISKFNNTLLISDEKNGLLFYNLNNSSKNWFSKWEGNRFFRLMSSVIDRDGYLHCLDYDKETVFNFSPVQKTYSNLDIEITSVDIEQFPVVAFYLNVRSKDGKPVYALNSNNFKITEDKAAISNIYVDYLKKRPSSVSIAMCLDRSPGNRKYHNEIPWVSDFILKKMRKNDSVKVINFNSDYWEENGFDWSRRRTLRAIKKRKYNKTGGMKGSSIYKNGKNIGSVLYNAISDLIPRLNRRGVLLITNGSVDENSFNRYSPGHVIEYAKSHYIPVFIISFKTPHHILRRIASETGGALYRPTEINSLNKIYSKLKSSEEYRYVLIYSTFKLAAFTGWWSDVKIEANYKKQKGLEWGGYFVPKQ